MSRKVHFSSLLALTMAASLAGCGDSGGNNNNTGDMAVANVVDMAMMAGPKDMTTLKPTGAECTTAGECAPSTSGTKKGVCTKSSMFQMMNVQWAGGYCQSPCLAKNSDPSTGLSSDCPGDNPTCFLTSQSGGLCIVACQGYGDCRAGGDYVCATVAGGASAACIPLKASGCDPDGDPLPQGKKCGQGERCTSFSPDDTYGQCATICDPIAQGCPDEGDVCLVDRNDAKGGGTCIGTINPQGVDGDPCTYLNSCAAGFQCHQGKCRRYCRTGGPDGGLPAPDGGVPTECPGGLKCTKITNSKFQTSVLGVCAP